MFKIGTVYRFPKDTIIDQEFIDGVPNYFYVTKGKMRFQYGIHKAADVIGPDRIKRTPLFIISSSPHKEGKKDTPWKDLYASDLGYIKYLGDNKSSFVDSASGPGNNKYVLKQLVYANSQKEQRELYSVPFLFFERAKKGFLVFKGFGFVESAERVTQFNSGTNEYFPNYLFRFCVF